MQQKLGSVFITSQALSAALLFAGVPVTQALAAPVAHPVYTIPPCRILDTRQGSGVYDGKLSPGQSLSLRVSGSNIILQGGNPSNCPSIPVDAAGVFVNVIAVETEGSFNNDLGIKPYSGSSGVGGGATAINYNPGTFAINNGLMVGTCFGAKQNGDIPGTTACDQDITLNNGMGGSAYVVIDVTGYLK